MPIRLLAIGLTQTGKPRFCVFGLMPWRQAPGCHRNKSSAEERAGRAEALPADVRPGGRHPAAQVITGSGQRVRSYRASKEESVRMWRVSPAVAAPKAGISASPLIAQTLPGRWILSAMARTGFLSWGAARSRRDRSSSVFPGRPHESTAPWPEAWPLPPLLGGGARPCARSAPRIPGAGRAGREEWGSRGSKWDFFPRVQRARRPGLNSREGCWCLRQARS
jgi:hypothetical protein